MRYQVRLHPTLDVLVSSVGEVFVDSPHSKPHWTFGRADSHGYLQVGINGKLYQVHRLVAGTFLSPGNKPEVDHLNRNPQDNRVENLRWATRSDNMRNTSKNDRVDARGGTHTYEDEKQYWKELDDRRRKMYKYVCFSDGKKRWVPKEQASELLKLPVKDRHYGK